MAGQPTIQGARDLLLDYQDATAGHAAYFNVLGNAPLLYADQLTYGYAADVCHSITKHVVDFPGELKSFSAKTDGNTMPVNTILSIRINDVDTAQVIVVESEISGKYECSEPAVAFVSTDEIVGYSTSPTTAPTGGSPEILQVYVQMTPSSGTHTCFRSVDSMTVGSGEAGSVAQVAMSGSLNHYHTYRSSYYADYSADALAPTQMRVRSAGSLSYLQAHVESISPTDIGLLGIRKNDDRGDGPNLVITGADFWGHYVNTTETLDVESGDLVNYIAALGGVSGSMQFWSVGCNFSGNSSSTGIDVMVYENPGISGASNQAPTEGERLTYFDWWDYLPTRPDTDASENVFTGRTTWKMSAFGSQVPQLLAWDMPKSDAPAFSDEYLALMIRNRQIEPTFEFTVRSLRVYMDANYSGTPLLVFISKGFVGYIAKGGLFVEVEDAGWYENSSDSEDFPVDDVTENAAFGTGMCITVIPANYTPIYNDFGQRDQYEYTTSAIAHIASIGFTYRAESNDRECLVRVLPDAEPVVALPNFTRLVRSIKVTRPDGIVNAYTEHDEDIVHEGVTYKAIGGGMKATASELGAQLGDVGNMEFQGYSAPGGIQADDLFGGAYDSAEIEVWLLPWGPDNDQEARRIGGGVLGRNRQADDSFSIEALSWSSHLSQRSLLEIVTPTCRYELGETRCGVVLPCLTVTGSVTLESDETTAMGVRRRFQDILRFEAAGRFSEGIVTFTTGPNAGHSRKIKTHEALGIFTLWDPFVYPIGYGDDYSMSPGCDKKAATCRTKFENFVNFGGFPTVPGSDASSQTPSGKMGQ